MLGKACRESDDQIVASSQHLLYRHFEEAIICYSMRPSSGTNFERVALQILRSVRHDNRQESARFSEHGLEKPRQSAGPVCALPAAVNTEDIDALTEAVIGCAIAVHTTLGPGLLESVYRDCLAIELRKHQIPFESEKRVPIIYDGERLRDHLKIDLLVGGRVVVEIKAVERLHPVFKAQVITYLRIADCPAGLLFNFNSTSLRGGLHRLDHPDVYARKKAHSSAKTLDASSWPPVNEGIARKP